MPTSRGSIWATGQDQCAVIKRQLQLLLPGVVVFLDVDDLKDIGDLEGYVRATGVMLFFLSRRYFQSRNCLREVRASLEQEKPLVLVQEQQDDKGGGPLDSLMGECPEDLRLQIFDGRTPIVWHRISHYQNLTLKLIATEMLYQQPQYRSSTRQSTSGAVQKQEASLVLPGELNLSELALAKPLVIWCSPGNLGAQAVAQELIAAMQEAGHHESVRVVTSKPDADELALNDESSVMLLYLNRDTWVKQGEALERDVDALRSLARLSALKGSRGSKIFSRKIPTDAVASRSARRLMQLRKGKSGKETKMVLGTL